MDCPICKRANVEELGKGEGYKKFKCTGCKVYFASEEFLEDKEPLIGDSGYILSGYSHSRNIKGGKVIFDTKTIGDIIAQAPKTPTEKAFVLLENFCLESKFYGDEVDIEDDSHISAGYCRNTDELLFLAKFLSDRGFITSEGDAVGLFFIKVNVEGWNYFEESMKVGSNSDQAFIAMSFDDSLDDVYDNGIRPALVETGYKPYRIDREEHAERIDDLILATIKKCRFIVTDFTQQRQGVYFEAGYAYGLGIPVIWTCKKSDITNLHFDTRQFNHIDWETPEELKERLANRIRVIIGER